MSEWVRVRAIKKSYIFHDLKLNTEYDINAMTQSSIWENLKVFFNIDSYEIPFDKGSMIIDIKPNLVSEGDVSIITFPATLDKIMPNVDMTVNYSIRNNRYINFYIEGSTKVLTNSVRISCMFLEGD